MKKSESVRAVFFPGEEPLESMAVQIRKQGPMDEPEKYLADGVIRFQAMSDAEVLILETSGAYHGASPKKASFGHHKAMFGCMAIKELM